MKSLFWPALWLLASIACSAQKPARDASAANAEGAMVPASATAPSEPANRVAAEPAEDDSQAFALDQGESQADLSISHRIREAIILDDTLSFSAMDVRIFTSKGKVTLRGAIANERERTMIENIAKDIAGPDNIDNQLVVR